MTHSSVSLGSFLLHSFLASVKETLRELSCRRQERIGMRVITYVTKKINLANKIQKNQKYYPVTSITNNFKYASYQKAQETQGEDRHIEVVSPDPSFATLDVHSGTEWLSL